MGAIINEVDPTGVFIKTEVFTIPLLIEPEYFRDSNGYIDEPMKKVRYLLQVGDFQYWLYDNGEIIKFDNCEIVKFNNKTECCRKKLNNMVELSKNVWLKGFDSEPEYKSYYDLMKVEGYFPIIYHGESKQPNIGKPYCIIYKTC